MILASIVFCAAQIGLDQIDFYCEGEISDALSIDLGISLFMPQASIAHTQEQFIAYLQVEYIC